MASEQGGAGMRLAWERDSTAGYRMVVQGVLPKGPADAAGVRAGDEILGVAGEAVLGKNIEQTAALLAGPPGSTVELAVASRGCAPRTAVVRRQVLGQPTPASSHSGGQAKAGGRQPPPAGSGQLHNARTDPERPVSTSSDASFVHVDGSWDDCFAALAQDEYAGKAAERLEAAVQAWRAGTDPRGEEPHECDARLLHLLARWACEFDGDVQQVPAGGDGGFEALGGQREHTCGLHTRTKDAPTALLVLSFPGKSKEGQGGGDGEHMVVHLHAGALHPSVQTPAASTESCCGEVVAGANDATGGAEGIEGFEHINLSTVVKTAVNGHSTAEAAGDAGADVTAKQGPSMSVDGVSSGLVSAVSWLLAIEVCKKNAVPLPTAITLLVEGAYEFSLGSPTLRRLAPLALRSSSRASPAMTKAPRSANPRKESQRKPRSGVGGGAGTAGSGEGGRGGRSWIPNAISLLTLSGAVPCSFGEWMKSPTVCHGLKGSMRLSIELHLGSAAAHVENMADASAEKVGVTGATVHGGRGSPPLGAGKCMCFHPGYDSGLIQDPVGVLAAALVKVHEHLEAESRAPNGENRGALSLCVDAAVLEKYKVLVEEESMRRARWHADVPEGPSSVDRVRREWLGPVLCLRRICGVVGRSQSTSAAEAGCVSWAHEGALGFATAASSSNATRPLVAALPPPISQSARADVELLASHMPQVERLVADFKAFFEKVVAGELGRAGHPALRFAVQVQCSEAFSPILLPPVSLPKDADAESSPGDEETPATRAVRACHAALRHVYGDSAGLDGESGEAGDAAVSGPKAGAPACVLLPACIPIASVLSDLLADGSAGEVPRCPLAIFTPHPPLISRQSPCRSRGVEQCDDKQLVQSVNAVLKYIQLVGFAD